MAADVSGWPFGLCRLQKRRDALVYAAAAIFPGVFYVPGEFAINLYREMVFTADSGQFLLDHRVELFDAQYLCEPV